MATEHLLAEVGVNLDRAALPAEGKNKFEVELGAQFLGRHGSVSEAGSQSLV